MNKATNVGVIVLHLDNDKPLRWRAQRRRYGITHEYRFLQADILPGEWTPWREWDGMCAILFEAHGAGSIICYHPA